MGKDSLASIQADEFEPSANASFPYLGRVKPNRMKVYEMFPEFLNEGCLAHTGKARDKDVFHPVVPKGNSLVHLEDSIDLTAIP
jgi:hypothetical protein